MQPPKPVLSRAEWERMQTVPIRESRALTGAPPHRLCECGVTMHYPRGEAPYCPVCRMNDDLDTARRCGRARMRLMEAVYEGL